ncbi:MAG: hypothetical protein JSW08_02800 [archaeon]|nr:MAG: hypothetical protein JSW08_02800 [archaeon]
MNGLKKEWIKGWHGDEISYSGGRYCPGKQHKCHYHTRPWRQLIHSFHCYLDRRCQYGTLKQVGESVVSFLRFCFNGEPKTLEDKTI